MKECQELLRLLPQLSCGGVHGSTLERWNSTQRFELDMSAREGGTYLGSRIELPHLRGGNCMTRSDLELATDFVRRWKAPPSQRRGRLGKELPVAAVQAAALSHYDLEIRRLCLFLLDHYASDASWDTFRRALHDPVATVREFACTVSRVSAADPQRFASLTS